MNATRLSGVMQYAMDLDASKAWYADFLGVEPEDFQLPMFAWGDGAQLLIAPASPETGRGGTGVWFEVEDVRAAYEERKARGYTFNEEPMDIPPGKLVTINDPDGNIVGLIDSSNGPM